jgi:hypothetical protein
MLDGIFDLLTAILVLGIVVAIAFGFILPLVNGDIMQYDANFEDKAVLNNVVEYDDLDTFDNVLRRKYTYPELVLFMYVQDTRMGEPNKIDLEYVNEGGELTAELKNGMVVSDYIVTVEEGDNQDITAYDGVLEYLSIDMFKNLRLKTIKRDLKPDDNANTYYQKKYSIHYQYKIPGKEEERYMVHTEDSLKNWETYIRNLKR